MECSARWLLVCLWLIVLGGASGKDNVEIFDLAYQGDSELPMPRRIAYLRSKALAAAPETHEGLRHLLSSATRPCLRSSVPLVFPSQPPFPYVSLCRGHLSPASSLASVGALCRLAHAALDVPHVHQLSCQLLAKHQLAQSLWRRRHPQLPGRHLQPLCGEHSLRHQNVSPSSRALGARPLSWSGCCSETQGLGL